MLLMYFNVSMTILDKTRKYATREVFIGSFIYMYMKKFIYMDAASTTPLSKTVVEKMRPFFSQKYGNPGSPHALGEQASSAMTAAREQLARAIGARAWELTFTSGGTEANNLAIQGIAAAHPERRKIIVSALEHSSVWEVALHLKAQGYEILIAPVTCQGIVDYAFLEREIDKKTLLVSIMHVNNEIGTIQDIARIGSLCRRKGAYFHTDAVQSFGKLALDVRKMHIDLLTASAHKIGGPKGIGFLYVRENIRVEPIIRGGGQERGVRGGTENVAGIVGFASAYTGMQRLNFAHIRKSRDALLKELEALGGTLNGAREERIHTNINLSFAGVDAEMLVAKLSHSGIYCSTRSACLSKQKKENRVLRAIGLNKEQAESSVRLTLCRPLSSSEHHFVVRTFGRFLNR